MSDSDAQVLAELPEMNPGPVFRLGLDGKVELANPAARSIYNATDLVGRSWLELCPRLGPDRWAQVLQGATNVQCDAELNGRAFMFTLAHRPGSEHVFVYGGDVTDLKHAERQLRDLAQFPEMNPGPVCRLDVSGKIVLANHATRALLGRESVIGDCWLDECPGVAGAFWDKVLQTQGVFAIEARMGGREFVFSHTRAPSGEEVFVYGADVTDQKAAERALLQTEKMATLGTLAAGVAHELNNPAAAAQRAAEHLRNDFAALQEAELKLDELGLSEAERAQLAHLHGRARSEASCACDLDALDRSDLEEQIETWLDERDVPEPWDRAPQLVDLNFKLEDIEALADALQEEHLAPVLAWAVHLHAVYRLLEEIRQGASRISEIVGAMKSYSYLGQAPVQQVDVNEGLKQTLIILRNKLKKGVHVVQELAADLPRIHALGSELNQVWTNLIDNAVAAMDGEGKITLRSYRDGDSVVIEVQDDGPGIPPKHLSRIFDAFYTTKPPGQGTGLGLHTCHSIVFKKHGGSIDVSSRPGETRFSVRLPIQGPASAGESQPPSSASEVGGEVV